MKYLISFACGLLLLGSCSGGGSKNAYSETLSAADFDDSDFIEATPVAAEPAPAVESADVSPAPTADSTDTKRDEDAKPAGKSAGDEAQAKPPTAETAAPADTAAQVTRLASGRIKTKEIGRYTEIFNDSNYVQLQQAERLGLKPLDGSLRSFYHTSRPLVKIESNKDFSVDELTHSYPFLVPQAAQLLHDIGEQFSKELKARGGGDYRIIVTSVLRTPNTVKRLKRVNRNAVEQSTHQYGTTFDITYNRFRSADGKETVASEDMKRLLGEVVRDQQLKGRCLVKYEIKSPCFHITVAGE